MTDREILELAAKAVGFNTTHGVNRERLELDPPVDALWVRKSGELVTTGWNPLRDDGDAFRLAVDLYIRVEDAVYTHCEFNICDYPDRRAETRKAIVYAAAEIGKAMK